MQEDALVKMGLEVLLSPFVKVQTQFEVQPPVQFVDVFVASDASDIDVMRAALGVLGDMASRLAMIEAFTDAPNEAEARACMRKQLALHHSLELNAPPDAPTVALPALWLLTNGKPLTLIERLGMSPAANWPRGF